MFINAAEQSIHWTLETAASRRAAISSSFLHPSLFLIGRRNRRARRETVQGVAGQAGHDVRVADGEGEVGVRCKKSYTN